MFFGFGFVGVLLFIVISFFALLLVMLRENFLELTEDTLLLLGEASESISPDVHCTVFTAESVLSKRWLK